MHRRQPAADSHPTGRLPVPGTASVVGPAPGRADLAPRRQLEKSVSWSGRERLRCLWYRLRLTVAEMNYATRRMVEVQASWIADDRPAETTCRNESGSATSDRDNDADIR